MAGQVQASRQHLQFGRAAQVHASLVQRLCLDSVMEGHTGCVNTIAWNKSGSLLVSGSDDTRVILWDYAQRRMLHSIDTGHTQNIFCSKFLPETGDNMVVSGAGDGEVRVHHMSRTSKDKGRDARCSECTTVFTCHFPRRVKKLAVEEGNPNVVWSAGEDGTLRQHDLRQEGCGGEDSRCRSILLDLRGAAKRSLVDAPRQCLALKTCAISPTYPYYLLVGGSDPFARLYDRRMLPSPSSVRRQPAEKPPLPVCYLAPAHLSESTRTWLHLTHVTFSPDGREALLSYSNEHVYLMDAFAGSGGAVVYRGDELSQRVMLPPLPEQEHERSFFISSGSSSSSSTNRRKWAYQQECEELLSEAKAGLEDGSAGSLAHAIECCGEVLDGRPRGYVIEQKLRHECLCVRAAALVQRGWKSDASMAIRDCNEARQMHPSSARAHHIMAEALSQTGKDSIAVLFAERALQLVPDNLEYSVLVQKLREKMALESHINGNDGRATSKERRRGRIYSITSFVRAHMSREAHLPQPETSRTEWDEESMEEAERDEGEDENGRESHGDYESEIRLEVEASPVEAQEEERREGPNAGREESPIGLRLRWRQVESDGSEQEAIGAGGGSSSSSDSAAAAAAAVERAVDMRQRFVGHCNTGTDIKQASFLGGDFIASGSDDGRCFIWEKRTARLVKMLAGDEHVVNCVQCHPFDCTIATSGIDDTIKLWSPRAEVPSPVAAGPAGPETGDTVRVMADNQLRMRRPGEIGLPMELLQRLRFQEGMEGGHHVQCNQS